jgi:hypothetical protein
MPRARAFDTSHIDHLQQLVSANDLSSADLATQMSRHFKQRITASHVNAMLQRMRTPSDPFFRNLPYRRSGARYRG